LSSKSKKAIVLYKDAEKQYVAGNFEVSLRKLQKAVDQDENFIEAWLLKADVERSLELPADALKTYQKIISMDADFFPMAYYFAGNLSLEQGFYSDASSFYESFLHVDNIRPEIQLRALDKLARANFGNAAMKTPHTDQLQLLSDSINSVADEYINSLRYDDAQLLFTRRFMPDSVVVSEYLTEKFFLSNYVNAHWLKAAELKLNWAADDQIGALTLSTDGNTMYFAACGLADGFGSCDIYTAHFVNNVWSDPIILGKKVNAAAWDSQPCISADGSTLYFVSKRKGGFGGSDLWKSIRLQDDSWSEAINLGDSFNTDGNEMAPYLHADGHTLYFSSTGHIGMGKADLFMSHLDETGRWSKPENLGYPINTLDDEINIVFNSEANQAFISSNRKKGFGGFDIYAVLPDNTNKPEAVSFVKVVVRDSTTNGLLCADYVITDLQASVPLVTGQTDPATGTFLQALPHGKRYALLIRKPGYCIHTEHFDMDKRTDNQSLILEILLNPLKVGSTIVLNNVFFDVDQSELKPESFTELDQLIVFINSNPDLQIELGGHTDADGDAAYNLKLSAKRAEATRNYLIGKGAPGNRISAKGYGSTQPIATNLTAEGKAKNRRTAFQIVGN